MRGTTDGYTPPPPVLYLKIEVLRAAALQRGWLTASELAQGLKVSDANISRLLDDKRERRQTPGPSFIAAVLVAFPDRSFEDFFGVAVTMPLRRAS